MFPVSCLMFSVSSSSSSSLVYHQAATITKATTTKITSAVLLSKPEVTVGEGVAVPVELWAKAGAAKTASAAVGTIIFLIRVCICLTRNIL